MCLAAAYPAIAATNPSVPPLTIRIDPIVPRGGSQTPPDQHFPQLDAGDLSLQDALYGAWRRRTRRELAVTMPPEVIKDAAEEIAKTNEQATAAVAQYIIKPTYIRVGNSARITAVLYRIKPYGYGPPGYRPDRRSGRGKPFHRPGRKTGRPSGGDGEDQGHYPPPGVLQFFIQRPIATVGRNARRLA